MRLWQVKSNIRNICLNIRCTNKFNKTSLSFISYISFISIILKISLKNIFIDYIYVFRLQLKISLYYTWFIKQVKIKQRRIARYIYLQFPFLNSKNETTDSTSSSSIPSHSKWSRGIAIRMNRERKSQSSPLSPTFS